MLSKIKTFICWKRKMKRKANMNATNRDWNNFSNKSWECDTNGAGKGTDG